MEKWPRARNTVRLRHASSVLRRRVFYETKKCEMSRIPVTSENKWASPYGRKSLEKEGAKETNEELRGCVCYEPEKETTDLCTGPNVLFVPLQVTASNFFHNFPQKRVSDMARIYPYRPVG